MKTFLTVILLTVFTASFAQLKPVSYRDGDKKLNGFSARPAKPSSMKAGILVLPAWMGIDQHAKTTALNLAKAGYIAFVADIYGEGNYPDGPKKAGEQAGYYKNNPEAYHNRIKLALDQLVKAGASPSRIVIIGFCFGGTGALEAARVNFPVKGVVSFHGGLSKDPARATETIKPKILVCHGADDPYESQQEVLTFQQEMRIAKADWQMIYYPDAVHAFTDPMAGTDKSQGAAYNALAAKRSWQHMLMFLKEII